MFKKVRRIVRKWAEAVYNACFSQPIGYIYTFHMVCPKGDYLAPIDELRVSPEYFEEFLREQQKRLEFISIDEVPERMANKKKRGKHFGVITFDDGYEDNYTYAYPILKKLGIPFTIYVSVNLVNDHTPIWNYPLIIERIVKKNGELNINGNLYNCKKHEQKNHTFYQLKGLLFSLPYAHLQDEFKRIFAEYMTEDVFLQNTLTWKQIEDISKDPLCTIGSHTMSHCRLAITDTPSLQYELGKSKAILEQHIGKPVEHLSYPYGWIGDVSNEAIAYAKEAGYKIAFRSYGGPIRKQDVDLFNLNRIQVNE
jgi:peptidoglycan/xylan/chitin deacetylase (PgdA/CDA1 family)